MEIGFQKIIYVNYLIAFIGNLPYSLSIAHKQFIILVVIYENTRLLVDVDSMLVDRLPRRPKIKTPLAQCFIFVQEIQIYRDIYKYCVLL